MCTSGVSMFFILHVIMGCPLLQKGDECDTLPCSTHLILYKKPVSICLKTRTCRRSCELLGKIRSQPQSHVCVCVCVCVCWDWCLNSGLSTCKTGTSLLEPHLQSRTQSPDDQFFPLYSPTVILDDL
jgi:hypothetical protein